MGIECFAEPDDFSLYRFNCCDTYGGSAFREWSMLYKHMGVFIGYRNHRWVVLFSSDPEANWRRGCQDSRANGDCMPHSDAAHFAPYERIPEQARPLAQRWFVEAVEACRARIASAEARKKQEEQQAAEAAEKKRIETEREPWLRAASQS